MVRYKTVHFTTVCYTIFKTVNFTKSIKSVDTEDKSTSPWAGWTLGLTLIYPGYGQSQPTELHQRMDWSGH